MNRRGNCSRSKLEQETITTHLLHIPEDSSGEFWNGKEEAVVASSNSFSVYLPCVCYQRFSSSICLHHSVSIPTPIGIWRLFSLVPRES